MKPTERLLEAISKLFFAVTALALFLLAAVERRPMDSMGRNGLVRRAAIYAAAGRGDQAQRATADVLARYPDLTIEGFLSDPG